MSYLQAIILGALQGLTEPFPVSSLGHSVIFPSLLGWNINQNDPFFLIFLVATHAATALVFFGIFWKDWKKIFVGMGHSLRDRVIDARNNPYGTLGWLLVVGSVPAGILGLLFEDTFKKLFASPQYVAWFLVLNGIMLIGADALRRRRLKKDAAAPKNSDAQSDERIAALSWRQSVKIGVLQCLALIPGFSRTGATITGGLLSDLSHEDAARFSFLLATPIIAAAALLKLPELAVQQSANFSIGALCAGAISAAVIAYASVKFLLKYFETNKLWPFGIYCCVIGLATAALFIF
jgi:undecaprenyl-diphosphatase